MDAEMREAGLIRQIQSYGTSRELSEWKRKALKDNAADGLDEMARQRVNREYAAQLAALLQCELAAMP